LQTRNPQLTPLATFFSHHHLIIDHNLSSSNVFVYLFYAITDRQTASNFRATLQNQAQHLMDNTVARTTSTQYSIFWNKWKTFIHLWDDTTKLARAQEPDYYLTSLSAQLQTTAIIHFISWLFFQQNAKNIAAILSGVKHQFKIAWQQH
jgi:hypothetical protein